MKYAPQLFVSQGNNFEVNPGTEIGLRVFVTAPAGTELMWESVHEKGYQYFDVSSSSSTGWFYVLDSDAILVPISTVIRSADEKCDSWNCLMPSSSYKLRLTAKHPLEGATYADVVIETLPSPKLRKIRVSILISECEKPM